MPQPGDIDAVAVEGMTMRGGVGVAGGCSRFPDCTVAVAPECLVLRLPTTVEIDTRL